MRRSGALRTVAALGLGGAALSMGSCAGDDGARLDACGRSVAELRSLANDEATQDGVTLLVGTLQVSANDQDAFVARLEGEALVYCIRPSTEPPDEDGDLVVWDGPDTAWVALSTDGGNTGFQATAGAFQGSYGRGGGPRVSYVARLDARDGTVQAATFLHATLANGDSNSFVVTGLAPDAGGLTITADSWYTPPLVPAGTCSGSSPFAWTGRLDRDLTTLSSGTAPGCL